MTSHFCPWKTGDLLKCSRLTNFHRTGEIVLVTGTDRRYVNDPEPYWVRLAGKPGHYGWDSFEKATADEIAAVLAAPSNEKAAYEKGLRYGEGIDRRRMKLAQKRAAAANKNAARLFKDACEARDRARLAEEALARIPPHIQAMFRR